MSGPAPGVLDPVTAYDQLAPYYSEFSHRRAAYLRSAEASIISRLPGEASSILDIGAGDGSRALRIAAAARIQRVVLLEPSSRMSASPPAGCEVWRTRAQDLNLSTIPERFDVITCLWNVLGHIAGADKRAQVLHNAAELLSPGGLMFIDVIHRYNVRSYGALMTAGRWLRDHIFQSDNNGDVTARWQTPAGEISTFGHVFTDAEMRGLAQAAELQCAERIVIDYETGRIRQASWMGNLLYVFRRAS